MADDPNRLTQTAEETTASIPPPRQVPYLPRSQARSSQTLIPYNMANAAQQALDRFDQAHGNIDSYLTNRLGYASTTELHRHFSAEQVDAAALAISNIERGSGFITGDQTGIGKGRICASIIRYARQTGKIAIFVTKDKPLYADMMRDVQDIGLRNFSPFITDSNAEIPLANGDSLTTPNAAQQKKAMMAMMERKQIDGYSAVFTTYSQLQTVKRKEPMRREFLRAIAPKSILILDEAHQAGGSKTNAPIQGPPDRATFVRELVDMAQGVLYSSATYAKRPDVMDLYTRRTELRHSVSSMASLESIMLRGGVPLQQIVASKLVASSHMLRRERSYEGIHFEAQTVAVDYEVADQFSAAMRAIRDFDRAKQDAVKTIRDDIRNQAKALGIDSSVGEIGARSTNFTSLMHNCIEQGLLAQKADATVENAIAALQRGEKPVIAVANTMGSFIKAYADAHELSHGDEVTLSFSDLLERYLDRSRDVLIRDYRAILNRHRLTDAELGPAGVTAYEDALECIRSGDFYSIPISPIDYIEQQLERAGYRVAEVTGRKVGLTYETDGTATYKVRPPQAATAKGKIEAVAQFNSGLADVILLNCSGSTGISLHASEKFSDQRPRHMIVAQAERDINVFMQMLGRIHRTGQVVLPRYTLLMSDIPAEKRPGALLCRKMASLNANTTAARESDISLQNVVDFMNAYGEQVVTDLLKDDADLNAQLDFPLAQLGESDTDIALVRKVTGRIPLLPIEEQTAVYQLIESDYQELVARAEAMGESLLEAGQLDLDAKTLTRVEVHGSTEADSEQHPNASNKFVEPVYFEVIDAKVLAKPMTQLQVIDAVRKTLKLPAVLQVDQHDFTQAASLARQQRSRTIEKLKQDTQNYRIKSLAEKPDSKSRDRFVKRLNEQSEHVQAMLKTFTPGCTVQVQQLLSIGDGLYGVVEAVEKKRKSENPVALHSWKIRILIAGPARELIIPLSKLNTDRGNALRISTAKETHAGEDIYELFDLAQATQREHCQLFTGDLIKAFEKYPSGKFINYTDHQGKVRQGLMMPKAFQLQQALEREPVILPKVEQVKAFLTTLTDGRGIVKTLDELLTIRQASQRDGFILETPKAKSVGGKYFLDQALLAAIEGDFHSVGQKMTLAVSDSQLDAGLEVLIEQRQYALAAFDFHSVAREHLGIALPNLNGLESVMAHPPPMPVEGNVQAAQQEPKALSPPHTTRPAIQLSQVSSPARIDTLEGRVTNFLKDSGLWKNVTQSRDFHFKILNEPYIPLVIERLGDDLCLTHYLTQNGDTYIDTEMVFTFKDNDRLKFKEVAVPNALQGGELRGHDRSFAKIFAQNIVAQGFVEAAKAQIESAEAKSTEPVESDHVTVAKPLVTQSAIASSSLKETADEVRNLELESLAVELGLERDAHDKHKWRDADHIISINDQLFMDWLADKGGGGAIDLVMHVRGGEFKAAVEWLSSRDFSRSVALAKPPLQKIAPHRTEPKEPKPLVMPEANDQRWPAVRAYLSETRKLPTLLLDRLHEKGLIYADNFQNAIFVRHAMAGGTWQRGQQTGASLRGTWPQAHPFKGMAPGTKRDQGWFWLGTGRGNIARVLLTESPIDAMSLAVLDKDRRDHDGVTIYLSVDGAGTAPIAALRVVTQAGGRVQIGFDSDKPGELLAWRLAKQLPNVDRIYPSQGKDWNEQLTGTEEGMLISPQSSELWQWYAAARSCNQSAPYLKRIAEVAIDHWKGTPLSDEAIAAMQRDLKRAPQHKWLCIGNGSPSKETEKGKTLPISY